MELLCLLMTDLETAVSHGDSLYTRAMSKGYKPELRLLFFFKDLLLFVKLCLYVCRGWVCAHKCGCPQRTEEPIRPGAGIMADVGAGSQT